MVTLDVAFKLVVAGDSGTGKSSLCKQFAENRFTPYHTMTVGIDFALRSVKFGGKKITLQTWDTPGQDRFRPVTRAAIRDAAGILLVYDITKKTTFDGLLTFMEDISCGIFGNKGAVVYLIGNKSDLAMEREVKQSEGEEFAKKNDLFGFLETSAKTAENVETAFANLSKEIFDRLEAGVYFADNKERGIKLDCHREKMPLLRHKFKTKSSCIC